MSITLTYSEFKALNPCDDRFKWAKEAIGGPRKWNGRQVSAADAVKAGATLDDLINEKRGFGWDVNPWVVAANCRFLMPDEERIAA